MNCSRSYGHLISESKSESAFAPFKAHGLLQGALRLHCRRGNFGVFGEYSNGKEPYGALESRAVNRMADSKKYQFFRSSIACE